MVDKNTHTHLYWATGCTSCLRAKEFLERNDVPFESHNLAEDMSILDEMEKRGLPRTVPIVEKDGEYANAQDLKPVADLVDIEYGTNVLPVDELYRRLNLVLEAVEDYSKTLPEDKLTEPVANRPRSVGELVYHTFSLTESFLEHEDGKPLETYKTEPEWANRSTKVLTTYGRLIQARLQDWYESEAAKRDWSKPADVYYGDPSIQEYFERTVWHTGQHTRQIEWVLKERYEIEADALDPELFEGLPMPDKVWNKGGGDGTTPDDRDNILKILQS